MVIKMWGSFIDNLDNIDNYNIEVTRNKRFCARNSDLSSHFLATASVFLKLHTQLVLHFV